MLNGQTLGRVSLSLRASIFPLNPWSQAYIKISLSTSSSASQNNWLNLFKHKWIQWTVFWRQNKASTHVAGIAKEGAQRMRGSEQTAVGGTELLRDWTREGHWDEAQLQPLKILGSCSRGRQRECRNWASHMLERRSSATLHYYRERWPLKAAERRA